MKKPLFFIAALLASSAYVGADPIDAEQAKALASAYMREGRTPELVQTPVAKRDASGQAPLYIFNRGNGQGFVIISGDDCLPAVLGVAEQGDFDPQALPPALLDWISGYSQLIGQAQAQGAGPRVQTKAAKAGKEDVAPLVTAHWSQGAPYNNLCPFRNDGGGRALTGCVATAAAQVAYYWRKELPDRSQYDTPTYGYGDAPVTESIPGGTPLQWELMQDSYGGSTPEDMNTAVATLMSVIGTSTWLTYGASTAGQISDLVNTFSGQLLMDSRCTYKSGISQADWEDMVYSDLSKGWPIVYSGVSPSSGGHAVVVDGYRAADNLFHFNFGWGGQGDGYYTVDDQTGMNGFNGQQGMTHAIHPRTYLLEGRIQGRTLYTRMKNTVEFEITNQGTVDYQGAYVAAMRNDNRPEGLDDAQLKDLSFTVPAGETAQGTVEFRPTSAGTYSLYLMDSNARILAETRVEAYAQAPELSLKSLTLDAASETAEETVTVDGRSVTLLYNKVYNDIARAVATLSNAADATASTPVVKCDLYRYDGAQTAFVAADNLTERNMAISGGETLDFVFDFGEVEKDILYAVQLHRSYAAGSEDLLFDTSAQDTIVYFRLMGSDLTLEKAGDRGARLSGHWNADRFKELASGSDALHFDLTGVTGISSRPETGNPNALFYLDASATAEGANIIKDGVCEELDLTYGYDFYAPEDFTARKATFNPNTTSASWRFIVLPFGCDVPDGSRARRIKAINNVLISESDEVNTELEGGIPYLYRTTQPGKDRLTATDVTVSGQLRPEASDTLCGTFLGLTAEEGQRTLAAGSSSFEYKKGAEIPAFSGYLSYDKDINIEIYAYKEKDEASETLGEVLAQAYQLCDESEGQMAADDREALLAQVREAASCYTLHPSAGEIEQTAESLEKYLKESRLNLIVRDKPLDLTDVYLTNASFENRRTTGWDIERQTGQSSKVADVSGLDEFMVGADGNYVFYSYSGSDAGSVTLSQQATGLKAGFYRIEAWLATDDGQSVTLFANDSTATMTDDGFGRRYMRRTVIDSLEVTDGLLTLGVKGNDGWYKADNFRLYYLGDGTTTPVSSVRQQADQAVKAYGGEGHIRIVAPDNRTVSLPVHGIDGRLVRQITVNGDTHVGGLPRGIYIVARQKVVVR